MDRSLEHRYFFWGVLAVTGDANDTRWLIIKKAVRTVELAPIERHLERRAPDARPYASGGGKKCVADALGGNLDVLLVTSSRRVKCQPEELITLVSRLLHRIVH